MTPPGGCLGGDEANLGSLDQSPGRPPLGPAFTLCRLGFATAGTGSVQASLQKARLDRCSVNNIHIHAPGVGCHEKSQPNLGVQVNNATDTPLSRVCGIGGLASGPNRGSNSTRPGRMTMGRMMGLAV